MACGKGKAWWLLINVIYSASLSIVPCRSIAQERLPQGECRSPHGHGLGSARGTGGASRRCWDWWSKITVYFLRHSGLRLGTYEAKATLETLAKSSVKHRLRLGFSLLLLLNNQFGTWDFVACECLLCLPKAGHTHKQFYKLKTNTSVTKPA